MTRRHTPRPLAALLGLTALAIIPLPETASAGSEPAEASTQPSPVALEEVEKLVQLLGKDREHRAQAIEDLAHLGPAVVPALKSYWTQDNSRLRSNLLRVFARIGDADSRQLILSMLASTDLLVRESAIESLASLEPLPADAIPRLFRLLEGESRSIALAQLVRLAPSQKPAIQQALAMKLRTMLEGEDVSLRREAVRAIDALPPDFPETTALLLQALKHPDVSLRLTAAEILTRRKQRPDEVLAALQKLAQTPDVALRLKAFSQLGELDPSLAHDKLPLVRTILSSSSSVKAQIDALKFLARWGDPEDGKRLLEAMSSPRTAWMRDLLIKNLEQMERPSAEIASLLGNLLRAYNEASDEQRGTGSDPSLAEESRLKLARLLGRMGHAGTVELLRALEPEHDEHLPVTHAALIGLQTPIHDAPEEIVPIILDRAHRDMDGVLNPDVVQTLARGGPRAVALAEDWATRGPQRRKQLVTLLKRSP
ncbi:HEAT repeat domain-containing protein [Hyalangium versicolor]|uniref:HEAT repeat domain-containing protein n=1 Tax=Hyalangium versicolor TaxID=2861190 RepID=UPI001CC95006|nr:HEAT repeat domain-containing protein [Hyalangium versicolor]